MHTGTIKMVKADKGYGFLSPATPGEADLFFHASTLQGSLIFSEQLVGQRVQYEAEFDSRRGKVRASAVWPASN